MIHVSGHTSRHKSRIGPRDPVGVVVRVTGILSVMILLNGEDRLELSLRRQGDPRWPRTLQEQSQLLTIPPNQK